ncbi:MAG: PhoH family protein [Pseudomonadota bacterium]
MTLKTPLAPTNHMRAKLVFDNHNLLPDLFGSINANLRYIEQRLDVRLANRGNQITISGSEADIERARTTLLALYDYVKSNQILDMNLIDDLIARAEHREHHAGTYSPDLKLRLNQRTIRPATANQQGYIADMMHHAVTFAIGPAGTGKTWLGVAYGLSLLFDGLIERMIITRPAVEAGERLGFLPGDMHDKLEPYLRPIDDALQDLIGRAELQNRRDAGEIEIAPLAYMRGRTLANAFILMDEAQNTTMMQMKMFLTRLGKGSHMVITGDPGQADLPAGQVSGLQHATCKLADIEGIAISHFDERDIRRHHLVGRIIQAL